MENPCEGCAHFHALYRVNKCCNYLLDTNHRRPCPPGAECTVKLPRLKRGEKRVSKEPHTRVANKEVV